MIQCCSVLTIRGCLQCRDLGQASRVDIERVTSQVFENDLKTNFKSIEDQWKGKGKCVCISHAKLTKPDSVLRNDSLTWN